MTSFIRLGAQDVGVLKYSCSRFSNGLFIYLLIYFFKDFFPPKKQIEERKNHQDSSSGALFTPVIFLF